MRRTRLLVGEGLRLGPGQGVARAGGWLGWPDASLGGLGCGLLARVAGWAGPEAGSRQVRQAGLGHRLVSDTSNKPALGLKLVLGSSCVGCWLSLKLVYGGRAAALRGLRPVSASRRTGLARR